MRVRTPIMIVNSTLHIGGAEQVAASLAQGLNSATFDVSACYLKESGLIADQMVAAGVELQPLPKFRAGRRDYLTSLKLRALIRSRGIKIIHTHDIHGLIDGSVCRALMPGLRFVHTLHFGNYPHRRKRHRLVEQALWRIPDALVAVGHAQAESIRTLYGIPAERLRVIWNGVDAPSDRGEADKRACASLPSVPVIASVSTLIHQKGLDYLLQAAALLRDSGDECMLFIAGDGHLRDALHEQARALRLEDSVRFLGWVPKASEQILPACDIFVQSSRWEAMSVVVLEAMAAGKPMVVTEVGENPHVVVNASTGLTVPPCDPRALADALRTFLRNVDLRQRMGRAAQQRYQAQFTTRHMIDAYETLYRELAGDAVASLDSTKGSPHGQPR